jgi:hypothetical protein
MAISPRTVPLGRELTWLAARVVLAALAITVLLPGLLAVAAAAGR